MIWDDRNGLPVRSMMSGHAYVIGARTGNIIGFMVKSKSCPKSEIANRMGVEPEVHECVSNWDRSSGTMKT